MNNEQERQNELPKFTLPPIYNLPVISSANLSRNNTSELPRGIFLSSSKTSQDPLFQTKLNIRNTLTAHDSEGLNPRTPSQQPQRLSHNDLLLPEPQPSNDRTNVSFTAYWPGYYADYSLTSHSKDYNNVNMSQAVDSVWFGSGEFHYSGRQDVTTVSPSRILNTQLPSLGTLVHKPLHEISENQQLGLNSIRKLSQQQCISESKKDRIISTCQKDANDDKENMDPGKFEHDMRDSNSLEYLHLKIHSESEIDKKKSRSNWKKNETRSLIAAVKPRWKNLLLAQRNSEKSRIWSEMFSDHCERFSGRTLKAFKLRWARLVSDFNSVENSLLAGTEPIDFDYYYEIREILNDEANETSFEKVSALDNVNGERDLEGPIEIFNETQKRISKKRDKKQISYALSPCCSSSNSINIDENEKPSFSQTVEKAKLIAGERIVENILQKIQENKQDYEKLIG
ncbi:7868_t:CDS:2, partial [Acaulospora morrowiae]